MIERRRASAHALLTTLLLAQGTPMLLAGDEQGHSQHGNNNAYCQDNALTWLDWRQANGINRLYRGADPPAASYSGAHPQPLVAGGGWQRPLA